MKCAQCGYEFEGGRFCPNCGTKLENSIESVSRPEDAMPEQELNVVQEKEQGGTMAKKNPVFRLLWILILIVSITAALVFCANYILTKQKETDINVLKVKGAAPNAYPGKTYGEAFEAFFGNPKWEYFVGEKEGPDDDGDGKPDYTEENVDIVQFTGTCMYQDIEVEALIQFTLDKDGKTFEATYLSFNQIPQNNLMLWGLMENVFGEQTSDETRQEETSSDGMEREDDANDSANEEVVQDDGIGEGKKQEKKEKSKKDAYILPDSATAYLTEQDLSGMSAKKLTYARNEIYARHGYVFQSPELNSYFEKKAWYKADSSFDGTTLTDVEKENVEFIKQYQENTGLEYNPEGSPAQNANQYDSLNYSDAYGMILLDIAETYGSECKYALFDLNNDGILELLLSYGNDNADWRNSVYTMNPSESPELSSVYVGDFNSQTMYYKAEDGNGIYSVYGHMGYQAVEQISMTTDNRLQVSVVKEGEAENGEYYSNSNPISMLSVADASGLYQ